MNASAFEDFKEYLTGLRFASEHTLTAYIKDCEAFKVFLEREELGSLNEASPRTAKFYLSELMQHYQPKSVVRKIASLRAYYRYLASIDESIADPFREIKLPKVVKKAPAYVYPEDIQTVLDSIDVHHPRGLRDALLMHVMVGSGLRVSEVVSLNLKDIRLEERLWYVRGKGGKHRLVPFSEATQKLLQTYLMQGRPALMKERKHAWLFVNARGEKLTDRGVRYILNEVLVTSATFLKLSPHTLRHTFASHMLAHGAHLRSVQSYLGHAHLSSTQIYTHVAKDDLLKAYHAAHPRARKER